MSSSNLPTGFRGAIETVSRFEHHWWVEGPWVGIINRTRHEHRGHAFTVRGARRAQHRAVAKMRAKYGSALVAQERLQAQRAKREATT